MPPREPIQIVELWQPRCAERFGVAPCRATLADGPRCYNCWGTCLDREHYRGDGSIAWRFVKPTQALVPLYERTGEHVATNPFPMLRSVSVRSSKINVGSIRDVEKPLGVTGGVTVSLTDAPFDDYVGDWYRAARGARSGSFWAKWCARNPFYANMFLRVYEGVAGDALADMERRLYVLDSVDGPDSNGRVTLKGVDPLRLTDQSRAQFPRETEMRLSGDIAADATDVVIEAAREADLSDRFGNTETRYLCIGSEIIGYTGYSGAEGVWTLSGVTRAALGTKAASHSDDASAQRTGRYELMDGYLIAHDLLTGHTPVPAEFVDFDAWQTEASTYLNGYAFSRTVHKPTAVNKLFGELVRDGTFYIWWNEREQLIDFKAVRPEQSSVAITGDAHIVAGSLAQAREPDERISRIFIYYNPENPTKSDDPDNYRSMRGRIEPDFEMEAGGADVRSKTIYSRWITTDAQAYELCQRLLSRFRTTPRYLTATLADGALRIGEVADLTTRLDVDTEGQPVTRRWQVIKAQQVKPGEVTEYLLQQFIYQATRYLVWMDDDAPDFGSATDDEKLNGFWWADEDGLMPDGSEGYLWQ
ncbi:hypothetical protein [Rhodovulum sulfidophilum]|uniref:Phage tail protein n=2 Tax=Rhodovulum sulfidophilum TaxID=35806 RepID=A0ABS1RQ64_RHOSU|nr:hypothetical protein [Rhodovulum sulfidophilum]MBL3608201.1 hypothetical protein [Rhodovulum sulfidophilum]MCE8456979.1 hypothetical protein [Rhodovulum sulfidophilum]